jgi:hypothetical protein|tara:strand:+ start:10287 stop:11540 length:1254 start_codon:yes stop_codon:yes gene_type:complete
MDSSIFPQPRPPEPEITISLKDMEKIERVVAAEANNEGVEGRDAVRGVIFNRLASDRFGDTIDEVLVPDQFEPVMEFGTADDIPVSSDDLSRGLQELTDYIFLGDDGSDGRVFFQNESVTSNRGTKFDGTDPLTIGNHTFYKGIKGQEPVTITDLYGSHNIRLVMDDLAMATIPEMRLGGIIEARKGITTEAGLDMASEKFQLDRKKADLNDDGEVSKYEETRAEAIQKSKAEADDEIAEMYHGGMPCDCEGGDDCGCMNEGMMGPVDPVSGNPIPVGSSAKNVRDDIPVMLSEGEYVLPAHVVKYHGLKHIMEMQSEAEMGLMMMHEEGLIYHVEDESESGSEDTEDTEVQAEGDTEQEEKEVIETPQGNEIEVASAMITEEEMDAEYPEEGDEDYYPTKSQMHGMMKKPTIKFIL